MAAEPNGCWVHVWRRRYRDSVNRHDSRSGERQRGVGSVGEAVELLPPRFAVVGACEQCSPRRGGKTCDESRPLSDERDRRRASSRAVRDSCLGRIHAPVPPARSGRRSSNRKETPWPRTSRVGVISARPRARSVQRRGPSRRSRTISQRPPLADDFKGARHRAEMSVDATGCHACSRSTIGVILSLG
jgi:hypothetical protein